ncbi:hypothetical protein ACQ4M3_04260 [Leptolyngbya sp. AN03gr2]|uniref:hypothetical protein n=1 Tax=unclassified Leptolyngbya TaxID=2650499 RepID=UPI003D320D4D
MKPVLFIHTSAHEIVSAQVAAFSHIYASTHLEQFDIRIIQLEDYPHLLQKHGKTCIRFGKEAAWYKDVPQSFLPLRFLVPQLMGYQGKAILTDPDIFATSDIYELFIQDMGDKAILSRKFGREKGYNSSVMLLDCEKLKHWKWENLVDQIFNAEVDIQDCIALKTEDPSSIGVLDEVWNDYDTLTKQTKLLHNTRQITQPWKTGLPFKAKNMDNIRKDEIQERRLQKLLKVRNQNSRRKMLGRMKNILLHGEPELYQKHPDPKQELFFFSLLKAGLEKRCIPASLLRQEIKNQHLRPDVFRVLKNITCSPTEVLATLDR